MAHSHKHTFEALDKELRTNHFRVSIFGSARVKKDDPTYIQIYDLAKQLGELDYDVVTGGGPGLMEAASSGHEAGDPDNSSHSIGLTIQLPWEPGEKDNGYLDIHKHFERFSERLDDFMVLSNVVVVTPGGIGTCLEFFYTLQLTQVKHICPVPIILVGGMWRGLYHWLKEVPTSTGLISEHDMDNVFLADDNGRVISIIKKVHSIYKKEGADYCVNYKKYKLD